jgi:hypothetical protein
LRGSPRNEGMERRTALVVGVPPCGGARLAIGTLAIRRSTCGVFAISGPRFQPPLRLGFATLLIEEHRWDFAEPSSANLLSAELPAGGHNASGRGPGPPERAACEAAPAGAAPPGSGFPSLAPGLISRGESPPRGPGCSTSGSPLEAPLMSRPWTISIKT